MQAVLEMKQTKTHTEQMKGPATQPALQTTGGQADRESRIYNIWYRGRLIYIRAYGRKQVRDYFRKEECLRIGNIYECTGKWLWPEFDRLRGDVKFDLTRNEETQ